MGRQRDRVLRALCRHPEGLTRVDFMAPNMVDGGYPILNFPARIKELRDEGHDIYHDGERYSCHVFKIRVEVPVASVSADSSPLPSGPDAGGHLDPEPGGTLFELPHKPTSPYDEAA